MKSERAYTAKVKLYSRTGHFLLGLVCLAGCEVVTRAQQPASKPATSPPEQAPVAAPAMGQAAPAQSEEKEQKEKKAAGPQLPFQIQVLETQMRFEANGDSRKEVHTIVKILNVLGVQQFGRISFEYNRAFQQVEIPTVRLDHKNGGTSVVLPSAVTDVPNPAAEHFPFYQDARVKSVRILGLQEGDTLEYRVIMTTTKHPLAPDFWVEHTFDRSGQVLEEHYELDLPAARKVEPRINPAAPPATKETNGTGEQAFTIYRWRRIYTAPKDGVEPSAENVPADVSVSTFTWDRLSARLAEMLLPGSKPSEEIKGREEAAKELGRRPVVGDAVREKALSLTKDSKNEVEKLKAVYAFVATQINTVDLPLGGNEFHARPAVDILNSGYATAEDKYVLLAALSAAVGLRADAVLTGFCDKRAQAIPDEFKHLVAIGSTKEKEYWLDPAVEVAPFGMITPSDAKCAFQLRRDATMATVAGQEWVSVPKTLPFAAFQKVSVEAAITADGALSAKVKYVLRGENELLLRVAFHQSPKEKWKDIASLLAISDGFRGQVTSADASDPLSTEEAFEVQYELTQLKFVDWSKKPVRIPALLPQIGLPDLPPPAPQGRAAPKIELGTPLDVQTSMSLKLPEGTTAQPPAGTAVARDYATYASKYSSTTNTVVASRQIDFLKREILADRVVDYTAFLRTVQVDQAQRIILEPPTKP